MLHAICFHFPFTLHRALALLPLLFVLSLCPQVRAAGVDTVGSTKIVISGDGSTIAYAQGSDIHSTSGSFSDGSSAVAGSTLIDVTSDGWILGGTAGTYHLYNGASDVNISDTVTSISVAKCISPDGLWLFGTDTDGRAALWSSASRNWDSYYTEYTDTFGNLSINAVSNVSSDGKRRAVGQNTTTNVPWVYRFDPTHAYGMHAVELARSSSVTSLANSTGTATDITPDGYKAVGYLNNGVRNYAVRWAGLRTNSYGNLTILPDDGGALTQTSANAINGDGSVIVGTVSGAYVSAAYWTEHNYNYTFQTLYDALTAKGVSLSSPQYLRDATGVSDDGTIIVGLTDNGKVFIAKMSGMAEGGGSGSGDSGVITVGELDQSLGVMGQVGPSVANMGQLSMSRLGSAAVGQGMHFSVTGAGSGGTPSAAGAETGLSSGDAMPGRLDLWMIGSVGTNIELNGDDLGLHGGIGLSWDNGGQWRFGAGLFGDDRDLDTDHGGNQRIKALGPGAFVVYTPEGTGLQFRVSALWQPVDLKLKRGYANGAGSATSTGSTDAEVFGLSGRAQWTKILTESLALTPFAEYTWQNTHIGSSG